MLFCNQVAKAAEFKHLSFIQGSIQEIEVNLTDVLIALHACDTATDDAIVKGIRANASLIVVAPCCHKEIRRQLGKAKKSNDLDPLLRFGIFQERQAEMLTDSLRALVLEAHGYKVNVIEFISDQHTPKNVMIIAERVKHTHLMESKAMNQLQVLKSYFGLSTLHIEKLI